jgi:hypothetical protein
VAPEITLITKGDANPLMSKRVFLDERGKIRSDGSQCLMVQGVAARATAETANDVAEHIVACGSDQALALGALKSGLPDSVAITTERKLTNRPDAISRSRHYIDYRQETPAWALIDFDTKGMPANIAAAIEAAGGGWSALLRVAPGLQSAARVSRASTSAGLFRTDTGEQFAGSGGAHHYVLVKDGGDIERFLRDLHDRCWLHGLGWHLIGAAGQLLDRSVVDRMVAYGERLCFEGAPLIEPPLAQDSAKRIPESFDGEAIDTVRIVPRLSEYERHRLDEAKAVSAERHGKAAAEIRTSHDRALAETMSAKFGMPIISALRLVSARHRGVLLPFLELDFDHQGIVSVADVLANSDQFVGETLADPMEGAGYGRSKAKVMQADDGGLFIHSFAHGRAFYQLRHDARSAKAAIAQAPAGGVMDYALAILCTSELEADELADFAAVVAKAGKIGVRAVLARIAKQRRDREQAERKAAMAAEADGRMILPRPEPDGELTPIVRLLDERLAADRQEEPPMRDASGDLVEVRVREPWALHLLTSDGSNDAADDVEPIQAPAEPGLVQLTPVGVEMLLERYVRWIVSKKNTSYFGALPRPFIDGLMQLAPSAIPEVRAINTAPLISMSGNVIDGVGLDRHTGLVHRIDPLLRACLPADLPTEQTVREAVTFLFDQWLIDVALDRVGKATAIMLAMTLLERALLSERPAFFVTAGQRGGGKTTLVNMITLAALGRRAPAAGWSEDAEERKKALFSYLRQGVACLAWDNIARGSAISCPHIEKALTAAEISDRVLGVSRVETVPSTTVHIFTGNSIMPRGDMASRSLMLPLNVDRPDPENRAFKHSDPLAWTQATRAKIVRALYTVLIAGAVNRPLHQEPKTRFKVWWTLVGWPMEYAASLIGTHVDCAELMRAGEVGDEEASAASAALSILREVFGGQEFTAKDVVRAMPTEEKGGAWPPPTSPHETENGHGESIAAALGELIGKRLHRPTAHSIGKLFQKRLVGRPAWIGDGRIVATLRKFDGHNQHTYRVEVSIPGRSSGSKETFASADPGSNNPPTPHNPRPVTSESGNVGKRGNDSAPADPDFREISPDATQRKPRWGTRL